MQIFDVIQYANLGGMRKANLEHLGGRKARVHELELLSLNPIAGLMLLHKRIIPARELAHRGHAGQRSLTRVVLGFLSIQAGTGRLMWDMGCSPAAC